MSTNFKYVSLFSGIGGFDHAMNQIGGECVLAAEWDKYAQISYNAQFGFTPEGDVTKIDERDVPEHEVLCAGFPCQAFSVSGKRLGFEDARGTLFFEAARIAKYKQPRVLLFENVKGLVSHDKGRTLEVMIRTIAEIGYTVDFEVLNSKFFGVPQNRERIWIICVRNDLVEPQPWVIGNRTDVVAKGKKRMAELGIRTFNFDWPKQESVTVRLRDILETDVDEKYYLSDEKTAKLVAQLEDRESREPSDNIEMAGRLKDDGFRQINEVLDVHGVCTSLRTFQGGSLEPKVAVEVVGNTGNGHGGYDVHSVDGLSPTLKARDFKGPVQVAVVDDMYEGRDARVYEETAPTLRSERHGLKVAEVRPVLTPDYVNKKQNGTRFKDNDEPSYTLTAQDVHGIALTNEEWQSCSTRTRAYRGQAEQLEIRGDDVSNTLTSVTKDAYVTNRYRIRKLTPSECWTLQGFTREMFLAAKSAGVSNSQLYKQAGNSVTIPLVKEIGKKLLMYT
jgi:DNA (cytosine-5)-methyltransferase 1